MKHEIFVEVFKTILGLNIFFFALFGWIYNMISLSQMEMNPISGLLIVRVIGIPIIPVGVIVGYISNP